jgi:hypothetical protein
MDRTDREMDRANIKWDIRREGRAWVSGEGFDRIRLLPEKTEMSDGKLFDDDEDRTVVLGVMLEQCGADQAVRLGDPAVWRAAVAALGER